MNQVPKGLSAAALVATVAVSSATQAQLEEVIVTATKIETSIQDTPIAVSAFTQDQLDSQLIVAWVFTLMVSTKPRPEFLRPSTLTLSVSRCCVARRGRFTVETRPVAWSMSSPPRRTLQNLRARLMAPWAIMATPKCAV